MILVTGCAGYIGSHCTLALLEKGYNVVGFDNFSTGHKPTIATLEKIGQENFRFIEGDLLNPKDLRKAFENQIDAVIHFAAFSQVAESVTKPARYYKNNVLGSLNLLDTMRAFNVNKIVFSSTAAVYGEPSIVPIKETAPLKPINPYGKTKLIIENIMDDYDKAYGLKSIRLRYFNVAGADHKARIGEWHEPETHLIPNILKSTFNTGKAFEIYGTDYNTKDGTCVRDYINIEDLVNAHLLALEYLKKGGETNFFNLGTKEGNSVKEVFELCKTTTGQNIDVTYKNRREGDPATLIADNKKANTILQWEPKKTLEDSIRTAYNWEKTLQKGLGNA